MKYITRDPFYIKRHTKDKFLTFTVSKLNVRELKP